jgi:hypothetical protein
MYIELPKLSGCKLARKPLKLDNERGTPLRLEKGASMGYKSTLLHLHPPLLQLP